MFSNNGVEFPNTSNYKFRSRAKGSALVKLKYFNNEIKKKAILCIHNTARKTLFPGFKPSVMPIVAAFILHQLAARNNKMLLKKFTLSQFAIILMVSFWSGVKSYPVPHSTTQYHITSEDPSALVTSALVTSAPKKRAYQGIIG